MNLITISSILVSFCAIFSYVNYRTIKLPTTIGIMVIALVFSTALLLAQPLGFNILPYARNIVAHIDFSETLLHGMLSFLLFAGALHVDMASLRQQKYIVTILALFGTIFSTILVGFLSYFIFHQLGFEINLIHALLFGSLISPTDPIAVMAILKKAGVARSLEIKVVGESLFNDGIAVVLFVALLGISQHGEADAFSIGLLFITEAVGGAILGLILGYIAYRMLKSVDNYQVEIFLTLALVMGGYELATALHMSGPICMVVSGLLVGNIGRAHAMSDQTKKNLDDFWELIDEFLNAILFLLIGFELLVIPFNQSALMAGLLLIPGLLCIRFLSVSIPITISKKFRGI